MCFVLKSFPSLKSKKIRRSNPSEPLRCVDISYTASVLFSEKNTRTFNVFRLEIIPKSKI